MNPFQPPKKPPAAPAPAPSAAPRAPAPAWAEELGPTRPVRVDIGANTHTAHGVRIEKPTPPQSPVASVPEILEAGAETFRQRNAMYGGNYQWFGKVMAAMFPGGLRLQTEEDWGRAGALIFCAAKLQRYAAASHVGGHADSAHDLMVYAAMLEELTTKHQGASK